MPGKLSVLEFLAAVAMIQNARTSTVARRGGRGVRRVRAPEVGEHVPKEMVRLM